jgi:hypothetical protein
MRNLLVVMQQILHFASILPPIYTVSNSLPGSKYSVEVTEKNKVSPMRVFGNTPSLMRVNPT